MERDAQRVNGPVRVVTAAQAAARESAVIAAGTDSFALMRAAGEGTAREILRRLPEAVTRGVSVFAGTGNNGGDAWVVAGALAAAGCPVIVESLGEPKSADAQRARLDAQPALHTVVARATSMAALPDTSFPGVVVDGILGTGTSGEASGDAAAAITRVNALAARGVSVVALDVPSGMDATTGAGGAVVKAQFTFTYGTLKRGLLQRRDESGAIAVLDIGLAASPADDTTPILIDAPWVRKAIPPIPSDAHKGVRRRLAIIGGGDGMAGAPMLAARGAMRSGIGMVELLVNPQNVPVVQAALPETMAARWPVTGDDQERVLDWAHVLLLGPGLGRTAMTRALVERLLVAFRGPVLLDADALNVFEGEPRSLGTLLGSRPAIVTPHPIEAARLLRLDPQVVLERRFEVGAELAKTLGATVVLKGPPTIISAPDGRVAISASGAPTLGTAGSGDVLAGIIATLLGQTLDPFAAGTSGAWIHGRAGERAAELGSVRGSSLQDVIDALRDVWSLDDRVPDAPVITELPATGRQR
ncbi:MAG: NAD(P)H-hydrate dehydratase [Gemmatimonadaceae bacterium]